MSIDAAEIKRISELSPDIGHEMQGSLRNTAIELAKYILAKEQPVQETIEAIEEYLFTLVREGNIDCISCSVEGMMEQISLIIRNITPKRESVSPQHGKDIPS